MKLASAECECVTTAAKQVESGWLRAARLCDSGSPLCVIIAELKLC
jgi:hypothetical protein